MAAKEWSIVILVVTLLALIIYGIFLYEMYVQQKFIFTPYVPPPLENGFQPLGGIVKITPEQQYQRCVAILGFSSCTPPSS